MTKLIFTYSDNRISSEGAQALAESSNQNATLDQLLLGMSELREFMFAYNHQANILHIQTTASSLALAEPSNQNATLDQLHLGMSELREFMFAYNHQANILHIQTTASALQERRLWLSLQSRTQSSTSCFLVCRN